MLQTPHGMTKTPASVPIPGCWMLDLAQIFLYTPAAQGFGRANKTQ
jgi:hypothetical protein